MRPTQQGDAKIIPLHELPPETRILKRRPGRSRKIEKKPTVDDLEYHNEIAKERLAYIENHPMVVAHAPKESGNSTIDTLNHVRHQIAKEAAILEFNRLELEKRGIDTSQVSTRIIQSWRQVAELSLEVKKLGVTVLDPNSSEMQKVFKLWVATLQEIMEEMVKEGTVDTPALDLFFNKFSKAMEGWEGRLG